jgi:hypothetical protein
MFTPQKEKAMTHPRRRRRQTGANTRLPQKYQQQIATKLKRQWRRGHHGLR